MPTYLLWHKGRLQPTVIEVVLEKVVVLDRRVLQHVHTGPRTVADINKSIVVNGSVDVSLVAALSQRWILLEHEVQKALVAQASVLTFYSCLSQRVLFRDDSRH